MTFISLTFLLFFPLVLGTYWLLGRRGQNLLLVITSYVFYGWWDYRFCGLLFGTSVIDYLVGLGLGKTDDPRRRKLLLGITLFANLGVLAFFKYYDFFALSLVDAARGLGFQLSLSTLGVILPVGISFYTFQAISYTIHVYRRNLPTCRSFLDYSAYVTFFPQLVAGPIERATRLLPQFQASRRFDPEAAREGCRLILWGLFKKAAIADNLGQVVDAVFANPGQASGGALALGVVAFAFQIYGDFSGYSDIATGTARLFGIQLMRNFAYPYFSRSIAEFWRRWHISLSTWFRDYVYLPLGGSRGTRRRTAINILITFFVSGLWHGANWTFVIWGALNGLMVAIPTALGWGSQHRVASDVPGGDGRLPGLRAAGEMAVTFTLVCFTWVFFRAQDLGSAWMILKRIFTLAPGKSLLAIEPARGLAALALMGALIVIEWIGRARWDVLHMTRWPLPLRWGAYTAFLWLSIILTPPVSSPFIYFQF